MITRQPVAAARERLVDAVRTPTVRALAAAALLGVVIIIVYPPETEARILLVAMTALAWTFAIVYGTRSPWRATQAGRSVMATSVALGLIGAQLASVWIFGDYPGRAEVRAVVVLALVLTLLHRLLVVWRIQHEVGVADD